LEQLKSYLMAMTQDTADRKAFLNKVVIMYDSWINHYILEKKQASTDWKHATSTKKKFKARPTTRKVSWEYI
jgi:hypothetical protein